MTVAGRALVACLLLAMLAGGAVAAAGVPGPQGAEGTPARRQLWLLPSPQPGVLMRAYLFRPAGAGPFPLALINHGSSEDADERALMKMPTFPALTDWFVAHGYAVLVPLRPGHGATGGRYAESEGECGSPDYERAGNATADAILAAIGFMANQPFLKRTGIVVAGNSAGGWGTLALAARNPKGVRAIVSFAGGRGGQQHGLPRNNCGPGRLVAAAGAFGATARVPTLWLYARNDTYFAPNLSQRMADAYAAAGGKVEYHLLPAVGREGHALIQYPAEGTWGPYLAAFLGAR